MEKLSDDQRKIAQEIISLLVGQTAKNAKEILKTVQICVQEFAIVKKGTYDE